MDLLSIGILVFLGVGLVVYSLCSRKGDGHDVLKRRLEGRRVADETADIKEQARTSATKSLVKRATPVLSRIVMPTSDQE